MTKNSATPHGSWFRAWGGLAVGICVVIPVFLRLGREEWTWVDLFLLVAGIAMIVLWAAKLVSLGWTSGRRSHMKQDASGSSSEQLL
ncbi:hypothetical protein [Arthrobacter sp. TWP1-1]|uniref:hypothetical protein n=1 Tax=Arthrobacter sp. TWP1-1 TaxID=2804568 RepID=UPI003CFA0421